MAQNSHLFGPIPSRRLGRSLGIDLTPCKTCSLNCIFCQLGSSPNTTLRREEYVPLKAVLAEIDTWLSRDGHADVLTLSGCGEPTLHSRFGEVLAHIKASCSLPTALLTNGTLLERPDVRSAAALADTVKMTLSAWDEKSFVRIHRPHPELHFDGLLAGERAFAAEYGGTLLLEVFLLPGVNDSWEAVRRIARLAETLQPTRVQLNTAIRPPADRTIKPVPLHRLQELAQAFEPKAEIIAGSSASSSDSGAVGQEDLLSLLTRRPCTLEDICRAFGESETTISELVQSLLASGRIRRVSDAYYQARDDEAES